MIVTPPSFRSLLAPVAHDNPLTFAFRGHEMLLRDDLSLPDAATLKGFDIAPSQVLPVGLLNKEYCCAAALPQDAQAPAGYFFKGLRALFGRLDETTLAVAGRAFQIAEWARTHRYCGACATPMAKSDGERSMKCPACGNLAYPRIAPAMMALVKKGPAILLARNAAVPAGGRMSALAGFLDPGESVEDAVHREVFEEVGLFVKDLRYFGSQNWPFPGSLMVAFTAEYASGEIKCDPAEIAEARFFGPGDTLPELPPPQSISRALIEANLPR